MSPIRATASRHPMHLSVVIATYNRARLLEGTLGALAASRCRLAPDGRSSSSTTTRPTRRRKWSAPPRRRRRFHPIRLRAPAGALPRPEPGCPRSTRRDPRVHRRRRPSGAGLGLGSRGRDGALGAHGSAAGSFRAGRARRPVGSPKEPPPLRAFAHGFAESRCSCAPACTAAAGVGREHGVPARALRSGRRFRSAARRRRQDALPWRRDRPHRPGARTGFRIAYDPALIVLHRIGPDRMRKAVFRRLDREQPRRGEAALRRFGTVVSRSAPVALPQRGQGLRQVGWSRAARAGQLRPRAALVGVPWKSRRPLVSRPPSGESVKVLRRNSTPSLHLRDMLAQSPPLDPQDSALPRDKRGSHGVARPRLSVASLADAARCLPWMRATGSFTGTRPAKGSSVCPRAPYSEGPAIRFSTVGTPTATTTAS